MNQYPWTPERGLIFWRLERVLWTNWAGTAIKFLRYRNGILRRFWTRAQAQAYADVLNSKDQTPA